jgi:hypothetical protein
MAVKSLAGTTTRTPTGDLHTFHRNPRKGDVAAIAASLRRHSQYKPITVNVGTHTGRPNEVLAGNHTLMAFRDLAAQEPDEVGWRAMLTHWVDVDNDMCERIVVADNRTSELGGFDTAELAALIDGFGDDIDGLGFTEDDIADLMALIEEGPDLTVTDGFGASNDLSHPGGRDDGLINQPDLTQRRDAYLANAGSRLVVLTLPIPQFVWVQAKLEAYRVAEQVYTNTAAVVRLLEGWSGESAPAAEAPVPDGADLSVPGESRDSRQRGRREGKSDWRWDQTGAPGESGEPEDDDGD